MEKTTKIDASNFDSDQLSLGCIRRDTLHVKVKSKMILPKNWQLNYVDVRKERKFRSLYLEINQILVEVFSDFHKPLGLDCYCNESWISFHWVKEE